MVSLLASSAVMVSLLASSAVMVNLLASSAVMVSLLASSAVMVSLLASSAIDHGFKPRSGENKTIKLVFCCFSTKYAALRRKSKDWLARNQDNVSEWSDMSIRRLLFQ
jgi:hypothetical protein